MRRTVAVLGLVLGACGSTSAQGPGATTAGNGDEMDCHEEQVTGSAIPRRVCRTPEQVEADRKGAHDLIGGPHASPSPQPRPGGR